MDRRTDRPTDQRTDGRTHPLKELWLTTKNFVNFFKSIKTVKFFFKNHNKIDYILSKKSFAAIRQNSRCAAALPIHNYEPQIYEVTVPLNILWVEIAREDI